MLSIIIVNYKTPFLTLGCIESIKQSDFSNIEIIVVDNASNDNSQKIICEKFLDLIWIQNTENEGFGRANNKGIEIAKGEYLLFINSDVKVQKDTLNKCIEQIKSDKEIGVLGCELKNADLSHQKSYYYYIADYEGVLKYNLLLDYFYKFKQPPEIKALMGAFLIIPSKVIKKVGKFDPDFFMYAEEIELCSRIRKNNFKIHFFENAYAIHDHGASSNKDWAIKQNYLSEALLFYKLRGIFGYSLYHFLFFFNTLTNLILMWKLDKNYRKGLMEMLKAYYSNFIYYFVIPFKYSRKIGNGKNLLIKSQR